MPTTLSYSGLLREAMRTVTLNLDGATNHYYARLPGHSSFNIDKEDDVLSFSVYARHQATAKGVKIKINYQDRMLKINEYDISMEIDGEFSPYTEARAVILGLAEVL